MHTSLKKTSPKDGKHGHVWAMQGCSKKKHRKAVEREQACVERNRKLARAEEESAML